MMDFFEALRTRAFEDAEDFVLHELDCKHTPTGAEFASMGIDSTIEALKEMMVGTPWSMRLEYFGDGMLLYDENDEVHASYPFRFGCADGEEVVVMVFRDGQA